MRQAAAATAATAAIHAPSTRITSPTILTFLLPQFSILSPLTLLLLNLFSAMLNGQRQPNAATHAPLAAPRDHQASAAATATAVLWCHPAAASGWHDRRTLGPEPLLPPPCYCRPQLPPRNCNRPVTAGPLLPLTPAPQAGS